jgi:CubicO group peptidase (beta-lactamase class C family)
MAGSLAKSGEFGWEGAAGTWFRIDPVEDMIIVYLTQHMPGEHAVRIPPIQATIYAAL